MDWLGRLSVYHLVCPGNLWSSRLNLKRKPALSVNNVFVIIEGEQMNDTIGE